MPRAIKKDTDETVHPYNLNSVIAISESDVVYNNITAALPKFSRY